LKFIAGVVVVMAVAATPAAGPTAVEVVDM
jgi:hypothetical protein